MDIRPSTYRRRYRQSHCPQKRCQSVNASEEGRASLRGEVECLLLMEGRGINRLEDPASKGTTGISQHPPGQS